VVLLLRPSPSCRVQGPQHTQEEGPGSSRIQGLGSCQAKHNTAGQEAQGPAGDTACSAGGPEEAGQALRAILAGGAAVAAACWGAAAKSCGNVLLGLQPAGVIETAVDGLDIGAKGCNIGLDPACHKAASGAATAAGGLGRAWESTNAASDIGTMTPWAGQAGLAVPGWAMGGVGHGPWSAAMFMPSGQIPKTLQSNRPVWRLLSDPSRRQYRTYSLLHE
jgi:hypothetical protein